MTTHKLIGIGQTAAGFGLTAALYPRLPDPMPTHITLLGQMDGHVAKPLGPFVLPLVGLFAYVVTALRIWRGAPARGLHVIPIAVRRCSCS